MVEHAIRFTIRNSHRAAMFTRPRIRQQQDRCELPRMGERFRLRQDFDISGFSPHAQAILKGLKKYGMFVADNGGDTGGSPWPRMANRIPEGTDWSCAVE